MRERYEVIVDVDDVLYPWGPIAQGILERAGIANGKRIASWQMHDDLGVTAEVLWGALDDAVEELYTGTFDRIAVGQLRRLRGYGHRVHIVTARGCHGNNAELIEAISREQFRKANLPFDSLHFERSKGIVADYIGAEFAIDDGPHNCDDLTEHGVATYMQDAWHNQSATYNPRVKSMSEFADIILSGAVSDSSSIAA